jgi:hypothetical protein
MARVHTIRGSVEVKGRSLPWWRQWYQYFVTALELGVITQNPDLRNFAEQGLLELWALHQCQNGHPEHRAKYG